MKNPPEKSEALRNGIVIDVQRSLILEARIKARDA